MYLCWKVIVYIYLSPLLDSKFLDGENCVFSFIYIILHGEGIGKSLLISDISSIFVKKQDIYLR